MNLKKKKLIKTTCVCKNLKLKEIELVLDGGKVLNVSKRGLVLYFSRKIGARRQNHDLELAKWLERRRRRRVEGSNEEGRGAR